MQVPRKGHPADQQVCASAAHDEKSGDSGQTTGGRGKTNAAGRVVQAGNGSSVRLLTRQWGQLTPPSGEETLAENGRMAKIQA